MPSKSLGLGLVIAIFKDHQERYGQWASNLHRKMNRLASEEGAVLGNFDTERSYAGGLLSLSTGKGHYDVGTGRWARQASDTPVPSHPPENEKKQPLYACPLHRRKFRPSSQLGSRPSSHLGRSLRHRHINQAQATAWSKTEVVRRYTKLYPLSKVELDKRSSKSQKHKFIERWRERLHDISWLMRALSEFIARKANHEGGVTGRFWEGRFKSQALVDEAGLLTCMAYVDLNPIRAGMAKSIKGSHFTSLQERLCKQKRTKLASFANQKGRGKNGHVLPFSMNDYLQLVAWTSGVLYKGKRRNEAPSTLAEHVYVAPHAPPILVKSR